MLITRIITAIVLVAVVLSGILYATDTVWLYSLLGLSALAFWEWFKLSGFTNIVWQSIFTAVATAAIYFLLPFIGLNSFLLLSIITLSAVVLTVVNYQKSQAKSGLNSKPVILLLSFAITLLFVQSLNVLHAQLSMTLLLLSMAIVWAMDTGAYFSGRRFGKNKLASYVSPGKSWEGVWGGALSAFVFSFCVLFFTLEQTPFVQILTLAFGLTLIALFSVFGDLFESVLKRQSGIKDSGNILPGHGGILDRIDSLLIAMPLNFLLWASFYQF